MFTPKSHKNAINLIHLKKILKNVFFTNIVKTDKLRKGSGICIWDSHPCPLSDHSHKTTHIPDHMKLKEYL